MTPQSSKHRNNMVWIDLEMSGLDPKTDRILEIATIITDGDLNILAEGPNVAIHQSERVLKKMDEWNQREHKRSGLIKRVRESKITLKQAEEETLKFIKKYTYHKKAPLCGNSIHHDRYFLIKYMPKVIEHLHYRIIDVSSISGIITRWFSESRRKKMPKKKKLHKALDDIRESIDELRFFKNNFFK